MKASTIASATLFSIIASYSYGEPLEVTPYVSAGLSRESNLFLFADKAEAIDTLGNSAISDKVYLLEAGVKTEWPLSLQKIRSHFMVENKKYDRFSSIDFTGGIAELEWDWVYGRQWSGLATVSHKKEEGGYAEQKPLLGDKKLIDHLSFEGNYKLTPRFDVLAGTYYKETDFDIRALLKKKEVTAMMGARYFSRAGNEVNLKLSHANGDYPNRGNTELAKGLDSGYSDTRLIAETNWEPSSKSVLNANVGLLSRKQDNIGAGDFDGVIGKLSHEWSVTGKTEIITSIWRDLDDTEDQISNYIEKTGFGVALKWDLSSKTTVRVKASTENREFQRNKLFLDPNNDLREDDVDLFSVVLRYNPRRNIVLSADYAKEERNSNQPTRDYHNNLMSLKAKVLF